MHVACLMVGVQNLAGLRDGAEQWVVAPGAFLLVVIADCRCLGVAATGNHRAVKVERDPVQALIRKTVQNKVCIELLKVVDTAPISPTEHSPYRTDMGKPPQSQSSLYQRIVSIAIDITQAPIAQHQMKDHQQRHSGKTNHGALLPMSEAALESAVNIQMLE